MTKPSITELLKVTDVPPLTLKPAFYIDCTQMNDVKKYFSPSVASLIKKVSTQRPEQKDQKNEPLPNKPSEPRCDNSYQAANLLSLRYKNHESVLSTSNSTTQPRVPEKLDTKTMTQQELIDYADSLHLQLAKQNSYFTSALRKSNNSIANMEAVITGLPRKSIYFESSIHVVRKNDVKKVTKQGRTVYQLTREFSCVPPSFYMKKKKKTIELELQVSVPVVCFTHPTTRYTDKLPSSAVRVKDNIANFVIERDSEADLVWGSIRWYYYYTVSVNPDLAQMLNHIDCEKISFSSIEKQLNKLKDSLDSLDEPGAEGKTLLHAASTAGNNDIVRWLLQNGAHVNVLDGYGWTPLMSAISTHCFSTALILLEDANQINVTIQNDSSTTALHYLCLAQLSATEESDKELYFRILRKLLEGGASPYSRNVRGETPIHNAIIANSAECVSELLKVRPVRLDVLNGDGLSPLHVAVLNSPIHIGIIQTLVSAGADVLAPSPMGTPIGCVYNRDRPDIASFLQSHLIMNYFDFLSDRDLERIVEKFTPSECMTVRCVNKKFRSIVTSVLSSDSYWEGKDKKKQKLYADFLNNMLGWYNPEITQRLRSRPNAASAPTENCDSSFNFVVLGQSGCGKTTFLKAFLETPADLAAVKGAMIDCAPTLKDLNPNPTRVFGVGDILVRIKLNEVKYDPNTENTVSSLHPHAILLLIDLSDQKNTPTIAAGFKEIKKQFSSNIAIMVVGTKSDIKQFTMNTAQLSSRNIVFREVSSLTDIRSVHFSLKTLVTLLLQRKNESEKMAKLPK